MIKQERVAIVQAFARQYRKAPKKERTDLLNKLTVTTGYSRKHLMEALRLLPVKKRLIKRKRISRYQQIVKPLKQLWAMTNYACGKRLVYLIPIYLDALKRHKEEVATVQEESLLLRISSATIDRLLKADRQRLTLKSRARTKPGTLLKHQIPIRTFADWNEKTPGFLEIDTVHHNGDSSAGEYIHTLDTTDVATGWNECRAFMSRSERNTIVALEFIRLRLPFILKGIDFDTGGEFVNWHLIRYSQRTKITYTRAREGKKNDQNYIEQQNFSVVRRFVGYARLDKPEQVETLNQLYEKLSDYQNFFQVVMRLKEKIRNGTRVTRKYDKSKTAYQRVSEFKEITPEVKRKLKVKFLKLNPKKLLQEITDLAKKLNRN